MVGVTRKEWERMNGIDTNQEVEKAMREYVTRDSGERQNFDTGSQRDTQNGKGRFDLLPVLVLRRYAQLLERGAQKYGDRNWELGQPLSRYYSSAMRHLTQWMEGADDEDHLAAVIFNVGAIMHHEEAVRRGELPESLVDAGPNKP